MSVKSPLDVAAESPYPAWAMSALSVAAIPAALAKKPGMPSFFQCAAFSAIFGGAGYVTNAGDSENGAGIATAWCLTWGFLNFRSAIQSRKPFPLLMAAVVASDAVIYGKKSLKDNGYIQ
ncbi:hypothetical protein VKS41_005108 [Umbelopsis sp. WA50703]